MSDPPPDELRLRVTEEQMRRALGLREGSSSAPQNASPAVPPGAPHPYRRRFVRDGEVPVTLVHHDHDDGSGINKIAAARQALHDQVAARERAEHLLQEARTTIQALETKLAHERIGKDEALRRLGDELAAEGTARQQAEQDRDKAIAALQDAEERLREVTVRTGLETKAGSRTARRSSERPQAGTDKASQTQSDALPATAPAHVATASTQPRRRGRPPKASQPEGGFVEWWEPNWRERFR
jgi:hypothetical protein